MTPRALLVRGMLVGLAAGLLAYAFAYLFGEGPVNAAIGFEAAHAAPGPDEPELVTRTVQATFGLATAVVVVGAALGGVFGLAFAFCYGRIGALGARATALAVAATGFVVIELVPFLKYPANPPAVGDPSTISRRTTLYFAMIAVSVLAAVLAGLIGRALRPRWGGWNATLAAVGAFVLLAALGSIALPGIDEVPGDFPATVLWHFRVASVGTQLVLWTTLGLLFGSLTERSLRQPARPAASGAELSPVG